MSLQILYLLVVFISAAISTILGAMSLRFVRQTRAVLFFAPMMFMVALWQVAAIFANLSRTEDVTVFWMNVLFVAVALSAPLFMAFALQYTGFEKWVSGFRLPALFVIPIVTTILTWTNPFHNWLFLDFDNALDGILLYISHYEYGWYFWVHTVYSYLLVLIAMILILRMAARSYHVYRQQAITLMMGVIPVVAATVVDAFFLLPRFKHDISPIGFALTGIFFFDSINRRQFLNVVPIARDMLIENMGDGMLVLNEKGQVVDINPAAESLLDMGSTEIIGHSLLETSLEWRSLIDSPHKISRGEITLDREGKIGYYDVHISSIFDRNSSIIGRLIVLRDITLRKKMEEELRASNEKLVVQLDEINDLHSKLQEQVIRDPLTGLFNRRYLNDTLQREAERLFRKQNPLSILMIDIDHFKEINDSYGHAVGDVVLVALCERLTANVRGSDIVYRYGGEEFLVLMYDTVQEIAMHRAEIIRGNIEEAVFTVDKRRFPLTVSIGVATYSGGGKNLWEVIDSADIALYEAKTSGRNRVECARQA